MPGFHKNDLPEETNLVATKVVDAVFTVYQEMGPGLLESIYEACLVKELGKRRIKFERQRPIEIRYFGEVLEETFRLDLLVENRVVIEVKSVESLLPIHEAQVLTYLKLTGCELGLLVNFNARYLKENIKRVVLSKKEQK